MILEGWAKTGIGGWGEIEYKKSLRIGITTDEASDRAGLYMPEEDRSTHVYVLGSSGVGKSKGLATWILADIYGGRGCGVIDPHGDLIRDIIASAPNREDIIIVDLTDPHYVIGFNPLEQQRGIDPYTQALELVEVFRKIWDLTDATTPRLLEILRNSVYTLIEAGGTMLDIEPLLTNQEFRTEAIRHVKNEAVHSFWHNRFAKWDNRDRISNVESTLNKVSTFTSDPRIRMMLSSKKSTIDIREIMDTSKVLLINLSKGALRTNSYLLGALFVAKIQMAAMSRESLPPQQRVPWYLYVDEFQNYATDSFAEIMSEVRKYGLSITFAHQNLKQLPEHLKATILSNAKNFIIFRLDRQDAELMIKYMFEYDPFDLKYKSDDKYNFFSITEQQESWTHALTHLGAQFAYLKTKGEAPTYFKTYYLEDNGDYVQVYETIRQINIESGCLRDVNEIAESLTFQPSAIYEPDEPESFLNRYFLEAWLSC